MSEIVERAVKEALREGATEAHATLRQGKTCEVELEADSISRARWSSSRTLTIYAIVGKRIARSSTKDISEEGMKRVVKNVVKMARASTENPHWSGLPHLRPYPEVKDIYDKRVESLDVSEVVEMAKLALQEVKEYDVRVLVMQGGISTSSSEVHIANSNGVLASDKFTSLSIIVLTVAKEASEIGSFAYEYQVSRKLDIDVSEVSREAARKALESLGAKPVKSFKGSVILDFDVSSLVFMSLAQAYNGDNVWKGSSPLRDKLGRRIAVEDLTVDDNGIMPGGLGSSRFDGEGSPRQRTVVIERGVLKNFINNTYTANILGTEPTGNAATILSVSPTNVVVKRGNYELDEMIEGVGRGLLVRRFSGIIKFQDGIVSGVAKQAFLIENGKLVHPVKECMISGNLYEMINNIDAISKEIKVKGVNVVPMLRVKEVSIIGK